uniref:(northern house mosquito) hypothetical protein n=1 Tax=Culex pipiens TaxID=7175 RepID=A0A8D8IET2_CULPI
MQPSSWSVSSSLSSTFSSPPISRGPCLGHQSPDILPPRGNLFVWPESVPPATGTHRRRNRRARTNTSRVDGAEKKRFHTAEKRDDLREIFLRVFDFSATRLQNLTGISLRV